MFATDWATVSSIATAGATLVLAIATFLAVRSANTAARTAERSLLAGMRPVLFPSRHDDPPLKVSWKEGRVDLVDGGQAMVEVTNDAVYLAANLRNVGSGIAVLDAWHVCHADDGILDPPPEVDHFRRLTRDLFIPPNANGFWQGAFRVDDDVDERADVMASIGSDYGVRVDVLYGDIEGGQRTISRLRFARHGDRWRIDVLRHWFIDNPDAR